MKDYIKLTSQRFPNVILRVIPGHFATPNAHVNYYMDMSPMKARISESRAVAKALAELTGREVYDVDEEIEKRTGKLIPEIFAEGGEDGFRAVETEVLADLGKLSGLVLKENRNLSDFHGTSPVFRSFSCR